MTGRRLPRSLRKALETTGRFEVRIVEEFRGAGPETLAPYDLVVLNYYDKNPKHCGGVSARTPPSSTTSTPARAW